MSNHTGHASTREKRLTNLNLALIKMLAIFGEKLPRERFRNQAKSVSRTRLVGVTNVAKMNFSEVRKAAKSR